MITACFSKLINFYDIWSCLVHNCILIRTSRKRNSSMQSDFKFVQAFYHTKNWISFAEESFDFFSGSVCNESESDYECPLNLNFHLWIVENRFTILKLSKTWFEAQLTKRNWVHLTTKAEMNYYLFLYRYNYILSYLSVR